MTSPRHLVATALALAILAGTAPAPAQEPASAPGSNPTTQEGLAALVAGDLATAEVKLLEAYEQTPEDPATLLGLSQLSEENGDVDKALEYARSAERAAPSSPGPALAVGSLLTQLGKTEEALVKLNKALDFDPDNGLALVLAALTLRDVGREQEGIDLLDSARLNGVTDPFVLEQLGYLLLGAGKATQALEMAEPAFDPLEPHPGLALVVGLSLAETPSRRQEALRWLEEAIDLRVRNQPTAHVTAGTILLEQERAAEAVAHFEAAAALVPDSPEVQYGLNQSLRAVGDLDGAQQAQDRFFELTGTTAEQIAAASPLAALTEVQNLATENRLDEALVKVDAILEEQPSSAPALVMKAKVLYALNRTTPALRTVVQARESDPGIAEAHYLEGLLLSTANRPKEAEAALRQAVRLDPELGPGHALLGASLSRQSKASEAILHFQRALELGTDSTFLRIGYANALESLGRDEEAAEQMEAYESLSTQR